MSKELEKSITRRDFLRVSAFSAAALALPPTTETSGWQIPETSEIIEKLHDPDFFTLPIGGKTIFTRQFDPNEYNFPKKTSDGTKKMIMNGSCGPASIATVLKLYSYFRRGFVRDIRISQVRKDLIGKTHPNKWKDLKFIEWAGQMRFCAVYDALKEYEGQGHPISVTAPLTRIACYFQKTEIFDPRSIIEEANEHVFSKGGVILAFVGKYRFGHFAIFTEMFLDPETGHPTATVLDPRGFRSTKHMGIVEQVVLAYYLENWESKDGFFGALGVIPNFKNIPSDLFLDFLEWRASAEKPF